MRAIDKFQPARTNAKNGIRVLYWHYSCDPDKDPATERGRAWAETVRRGMSPNDWRREFEIDFEAHVGVPVYPHFDKTKHILPADYVPYENLKIIRGWDPGYRVASCVWMQVINSHLVYVLAELEGTQGSMRRFGERVLEYSAELFPHHDPKKDYEDYIDVAAVQHAAQSESSVIDILGTLGIFAGYKKSGKKERIHIVSHLLAMPSFFNVHPRCRQVISGLAGLYRYPEDKENQKKADLPEETEVIHTMHALEYGIYHTVQLEIEKLVRPQRRPGFVENLRELFTRQQPDEDWMA